jgi:hypothetical protein
VGLLHGGPARRPFLGLEDTTAMNNQNFFGKFINTLCYKNDMINKSNKILNTNITKLVSKDYQYGFSTNIEKDIIEKGLNEQTVRLISEKKKRTHIFIKF